MDQQFIINLIVHTAIIAIIATSLMLGFAAMTVVERKLLARFTLRYGPNRAGKFGLLQPIADMFKMFFGSFTINVVDPQIVFNDGFYDLVEVRIPQGTLLKPNFPAALSGRTHALGRIFDVLGALLGMGAPEQMLNAARRKVEAAGYAEMRAERVMELPLDYIPSEELVKIRTPKREKTRSKPPGSKG